MQQVALRAPSPWLVIAAIVAVIAAVNIGAAAITATVPEIAPAAVEFVSESILAIIAIGLLTARRLWREVGFRAPSRISDLRLYWVLIIPVLAVVPAAIVGISRIQLRDIVSFLVLACLIGFVEEVFFRGLILRALSPTGLWRAAVLSSVIFGAMHLLNLLFGADPTATLLQAVYATALGFGFAAVTLRTGILWPVIVIHALVDFTGFVSADETVVIAMTATDVVVYAVYTALFAVYGLFMMRSVIRRRKTPPKPDASVAPERSGPFTG